jgi:hypothetical protein
MNVYQDIILSVYRRAGLNPVFEYRFHPVRKWRMDIAFIESKVFVEVQGGIFVRGRHVRGAAMLKEWEKLNTAASMGWRCLFCQPSDVHKIEFIKLVKDAVLWIKTI